MLLPPPPRQVVCLQLNDPIPNRCLWPLAADLKVNSMQMRVYTRSSNTKPGQNQRDEPANVGVLCQPCEWGLAGAA